MARLRSRDRNHGGALRLIAGCLAGAAALAASTTADAYAVKKTSRGELVHWEARDVSFSVDATMDHAVEGASDATRHAMEAWGGSVGAPEIHIAPPSEDAPNKPGFDRKNGIFFMSNGYRPAGRALAITVLTYDNATGSILDADVIFNGVYKFEVLPENQVASEKPQHAGTHLANTDGIAHDAEANSIDAIYDLHHVVAHELGHTLGMNDEMERRDALMYRYSAPNDASMRAPASDDIAGLAELYSTQLEAHGNGCGNATVAPKKPSLAASHVAMVATFGFLCFLVLRARSNRKARLAFVLAAAGATYALFPSVSGKGAGEARASVLAAGHAQAKVIETSASMEDGIIKTAFKLSTTACRSAKCPELGHGVVWGGTVGNITQEVGGQFAPVTGDVVDVSFAKLPSALAPLEKPLAGRDHVIDEDVRVLTPAAR